MVRLDEFICNIVQNRKVAILLNVATLAHPGVCIGNPLGAPVINGLANYQHGAHHLPPQQYGAPAHQPHSQQQLPGVQTPAAPDRALDQPVASKKAQEACRRLGWPIGSRCVSAITWAPEQWMSDPLSPGDVGTVVGEATCNAADTALRVRVDFGRGRALNMLPSQIIAFEKGAARKAAKEQVKRSHLTAAATLHLCIENLAGKSITFEMVPAATIGDVKAELQDKEGVPPDQQRLMFLGRELEDSRTLSHYGIETGMIIHLIDRMGRSVPNMQIFVKNPTGKTITLKTAPSDTINMVKAMIHYKWSRSHDQQQLSFAGKQLEGGRTLEYYGVQDQSVLLLMHPAANSKAKGTTKQVQGDTVDEKYCRRLGWPIGSKCVSTVEHDFGAGLAWLENGDVGTVVGKPTHPSAEDRVRVDFGGGRTVNMLAKGQIITEEQAAADKAKAMIRDEYIRSSDDWEAFTFDDIMKARQKVLTPESQRWVDANDVRRSSEARKQLVFEVLRRTLRPTASMPRTPPIDWNKLPKVRSDPDPMQLQVKITGDLRPGDVIGVIMQNGKQHRSVRIPKEATTGSVASCEVVLDQAHDAALARLFGGVAAQPAIEPNDDDDLAFINGSTSNYVVACRSGVPVRKTPSGDALSLRVLEHGAVASGVPVRGWLRLQDGRGYVLIDGGPLYGALLQKQKKKKGKYTLPAMSVRELKQTIEDGGLTHKGVTEKSELRELAAQAFRALDHESTSPDATTARQDGKVDTVAQSKEPREESPQKAAQEPSEPPSPPRPEQKQKQKPKEAPVSLGEQVYRAALGGELKQLKKLLKQVGNEKPKDKRQLRNWSTAESGATPLHAACEGGYYDAASALLDAHFSANKASSDGVTPLYLAVEKGDLRLTTLLLDAGVRARHHDPRPHHTRMLRMVSACCHVLTGQRCTDCARSHTPRCCNRVPELGDRGLAPKAHARREGEARAEGGIASATARTARARTDACSRC